MEVIAVSIEGEGDGSCNWVGDNRPGISVFTSREAAAKAVFGYADSNELHRYLIGDDNCTFDSERNYDQATQDLLLQKCYELIDKGGWRNENGKSIRVEILPTNPSQLTEDHYSDWEIPEFISFDQAFKKLSSGKVSFWKIEKDMQYLVRPPNCVIQLNHKGQTYYVKAQYIAGTTSIQPPV